MKYIGQFGIILVISFVGEILNYFIPLPVPASIYGLVIMFLCLHFGIIRVGTVKGTADFLIEIMPLMFIPAAVELMTLWHVIKPNLIAYGVITVVSTFAVMIICGHMTQFALRLGRKEAVEPGAVAAKGSGSRKECPTSTAEPGLHGKGTEKASETEVVKEPVCITESVYVCGIRKGEGNGTV